MADGTPAQPTCMHLLLSCVSMPLGKLLEVEVHSYYAPTYVCVGSCMCRAPGPTAPSYIAPATTTPRAHFCSVGCRLNLVHGPPALSCLDTEICGQCTFSHMLHQLPK